MNTIEIKGKVNTAICYAKVVEDEAIEQIRRMCDYPMTEGAKIRIMPDVHAGKGCTIGTTMTITDKAVPNVVGVDIGCGMYTVNLGKQKIDLERFDMAPSSYEVDFGCFTTKILGRNYVVPNWPRFFNSNILTTLLRTSHFRNMKFLSRNPLPVAYYTNK